jgi:O-antigen/teichoic acid export membrane protein
MKFKLSSYFSKLLIWRSLQTVIKQGIPFLIFILVARLLDSESFGIYNYLLAIILLFVMFSDFGISTSTCKITSEFIAKKKRNIKNILSNSLIFSFIISTFLTILLLTYYYFLEEGDSLGLLYLIPLIYLAPISSIYDGFFRGQKKFKQLFFISSFSGIASIPLIYTLIFKLGLNGALISQSIFYLITIIFFIYFSKGLLIEFDKKILGNLLSHSITIGLISLSYFLYSKVDILFLGYFNYFSEVGIYEIMNKIIALLTMPFLIFSQTTSPSITRIYYSGKRDLLLGKIKKSILISLTLSLIIATLFYFISPFLLETIFNQNLTQEITMILFILLFTFIFQSTATLIGNTFVISTGHAKLNLINLFLFGIINLVLNFFFIRSFGFIGVFYSTLICGVISSISLVFFYYIRIKKELG